MAGKTGPALLKRKKRFEKCVVTFPERADFYRAEIERIDTELRLLHACQRCGRPLKGEDSMLRGYGPECMKKVRDGDEDGDRADGLRSDGEGYGGEDSDDPPGVHEA